MEPRKYVFNNSIVTLKLGDLTESELEVLVSSDDEMISMRDGVSRSILRRGGESVQIDAQKKTPASIGDVVVSTAGELDAKFVFHCISLYRFRPVGNIGEEDIQAYILRNSVRRCFEILSSMGLSSIAFPAIGAGNAKIPIDKVVGEMIDEISMYLMDTNKHIEVEFYLYDMTGQKSDIDYLPFFELFAAKSALCGYQRELILSDYEKEKIESLPRVEAQHCRGDFQVFISYSRRDKEVVDGICNDLKAAGITCWVDTTGIHSGSAFRTVIAEAISVCSAVVFVSSENSNKSENVANEIGIAGLYKRPIIPIKIDDAQYSKLFVYDLVRIDFINYSDPDQYPQKLLQSIAYHTQNEKNNSAD